MSQPDKNSVVGVQKHLSLAYVRLGDTLRAGQGAPPSMQFNQNGIHAGGRETGSTLYDGVDRDLHTAKGKRWANSLRNYGPAKTTRAKDSFEGNAWNYQPFMCRIAPD
jgi:hypothetical protein